jgi:branched-chain amino acid transport system substrate-binding protein
MIHRIAVVTLLILNQCFLVHAEDANSRSTTQKAPVKFGALLTLTGEIAYLGERCRDAILLAQDDVNAAGGIQGRALKVLTEDLGPMNLVQAVTAANKLISGDKVSALFPAALEDTEALAPIAERKHVPLMSTGCGGVNVGKFGPNVFRSTTTDHQIVERLLGYADQHNYKRLCLAYGDTSYFLSMEEDFQSSTKAHGITLLPLQIPLNTADTKSMALKLKGMNCDALLAFHLPGLTQQIVKNLREINIQIPILAPHYLDASAIGKALGTATGKFIFAEYAIPAGSFAQRYQSRFGTLPFMPAGTCYDAIAVMAHVMNKHGTDWNEVNAALHSLKDYPGVSGPFSVLPNGDRIGQRVILRQLSNDGTVIEEL